VDEEEHQIGYKVLARGTPVLTNDGSELGTVAKVLDNAREHIFDGIVVKTKERRVFVDAPEVRWITNRQVTLTIDAAEAAQLEPYKGLMGVIEHRAKRRVDRIKRNLPRR
jgi:hypothetical protein